MDFKRIKFSKEKLDMIPENERFLFLHFMILVNELNILIKLVFFNNVNYSNDTLIKAQDCHAFFIFPIMAGKLFEGWNLIQQGYFKSRLSQEYNSVLSDKGRENLKLLKQYFGKENLMSTMRNKVAFHFDTDELKKQYSHTKEFEVEYFISEYDVNCFSTSYYLLWDKILDGINSDKGTALKSFFEEHYKVMETMRSFIIQWTASFMSKHSFIFDQINVPTPQDTPLPLFVVKPNENDSNR